MGRESGDVLPVEHKSARCGGIEAGQIIDKGGLSGPVGSDHADNFPFFNGETDIFQGNDAAKFFSDGIGRQKTHTHAPSKLIMLIFAIPLSFKCRGSEDPLGPEQQDGHHDHADDEHPVFGNAPEIFRGQGHDDHTGNGG